MEWHAIVDRIEEGIAILIPLGRPGTQIRIERELLPTGLKDGALLRIKVELDPEGARAKAAEVADLLRELEENSADPS